MTTTTENLYSRMVSHISSPSQTSALKQRFVDDWWDACEIELVRRFGRNVEIKEKRK